ncbi:hypothetical protein TDB9533_01087 [Thalassocella blandensis]|nr:hypothetical protein TDB9533_01087 [Thalassocella blandensis]
MSDLDFFKALQFQPRIKKSLIVEVRLEELRRTRSKKSRFVSRVFSLVTLAYAIGSSSAWSSEETLRAAFVYNFMKFIQWPVDRSIDGSINSSSDTALDSAADRSSDSSSDSSDATINLCPVGATPEVRNALERLQGKKANKSVIHIIYLDTSEQISEEIGNCHMLYLPVEGAPLALPEKLPSGVILVVDEPKKYSPNIGITLTKNPDGRIEFGINQPAITQAGVSISSRLLLLAKKPHFGEQDNYGGSEK